jgi:hypothetical protein
MIKFFGTALLSAYVDPAEEGPEYTINVAKATGVPMERAEVLAAEMRAKLDNLSSSVCACNDCRRKREAAGEPEPEGATTMSATLNAMDLDLNTPGEVMFVGLSLGRFIGKQEEEWKQRKLVAQLFGGQ